MGQGTVAVDGARLHYERISSQGPLIVVVPGGPGLGFHYLRDPVCAALGDAYELLLYDQRGTGHSTGRDDLTRLTMNTFVEDLDAVRRAVGCERVILLGHSFGGLLAMYYALAHPTRMEALILVDSDPSSYRLWQGHRSILGSRRTNEDRQRLATLQQADNFMSDAKVTTQYFTVHLRWYFADPERVHQLDLGFDDERLRNFAVTIRALRSDLGEYDVTGRLGAISCPTLIVYGEASVFPHEAGQVLASAISGSTLVRIPGAGHFPHMETPAEFAAAIRAFLTGI